MTFLGMLSKYGRDYILMLDLLDFCLLSSEVIVFSRSAHSWVVAAT